MSGPEFWPKTSMRNQDIFKIPRGLVDLPKFAGPDQIIQGIKDVLNDYRRAILALSKEMDEKEQENQRLKLRVESLERNYAIPEMDRFRVELAVSLGVTGSTPHRKSIMEAVSALKETACRNELWANMASTSAAQTEQRERENADQRIQDNEIVL
ncbi:hypothetical protein N7471_010609 [Penicillium samsonianum]|uniref:uncharacterized protein n=1 Tax=Penicillium samsonianum TaxID=1882272 RepID=UPI002546F90B|nr:uncharacterized protein N7471_010609 [Penicillium samsonianum]KAJ6126116.1 hypothetical protein N7471_010609 [Penicillium samsonianum]